MRRERSGIANRKTQWCLSALLLSHCALLAFGSWQQSPTLNEPGHLLAGLHHWRYQDFTLYRVNPPLIRLTASAPVAAFGYNEDWSGYYEHAFARPVFGMGEDFFAANLRRSLLYVRIARLTLIPYSLLGAWICFVWARELFGNVSWLMACSLWCYSPMVLGHASLIAPDAHATSLGLAACYTFWRWLKKPTWQQAILTGLVLGLAELSKTTMILFYPLWPLLWLFYRWPQRKTISFQRWRSEAGMLILRMAIGIYILNLGYLGEGSFTQLKEFRFGSDMLAGESHPNVGWGNRFAETWLGEVPMPFPRNYIVGIDIQQRDFENFDRLRGEYQEKGWWYYYGYAILVKAPLGTLGLLLLSLFAGKFGTRPRIAKRDAMVLLSPAIVIFVVASSKFGFSHHCRYILPCIPFVFIWTSGLAISFYAFTNDTWAIGNRQELANSIRRSRVASSTIGTVTLCLLGWSIFSSLTVYPHSISYFNELAGGPKNGPEHLINSNVDWGQDLLFLEQWIAKRQPTDASPVHLAFYNFYNPFDLELTHVVPWPFREEGSKQEVVVPDGDYAISVNLLYEFPYPIRDQDGGKYVIDQRPFAYLRTQKPVGRAGYSIRIFSAEQMRSAYSTPPAKQLWSGFK
jgi:hypothetical protein